MVGTRTIAKTTIRKSEPLYKVDYIYSEYYKFKKMIERLKL